MATATAPAAKPATKRIKLICSIASHEYAYKAGDTITLPVAEANRHILGGNAVEPDDVDIYDPTKPVNK